MLANLVATTAAGWVGGDMTNAADAAASAIGWEVADGVLAIMYVATLTMVGAIAEGYAKRVAEPPAGTVVAVTGGAGTPWAGASGTDWTGAVAVSGADVMTGVSAVPAMGGAGGMVPVAGCLQGGPTAVAALVGATSIPGVPAAWYADPAARHEMRWWDGAQWTAYVADGGEQAHDPL
jgi:hypothetical protein